MDQNITEFAVGEAAILPVEMCGGKKEDFVVTVHKPDGDAQYIIASVINMDRRVESICAFDTGDECIEGIVCTSSTDNRPVVFRFMIQMGMVYVTARYLCW